MCNHSHQCPSAPARVVHTEEVRPHVCFLSAEEIGCERWVLCRRQCDVTHLHWSAETCGGKQLVLSVLMMWYWMVAFARLCVSHRRSGDTGDVSPTFLIHHVSLLHLLLHICALSLVCFFAHKWLLPGLQACRPLWGILLLAVFFSVPVLIWHCCSVWFVSLFGFLVFWGFFSVVVFLFILFFVCRHPCGCLWWVAQNCWLYFKAGNRGPASVQ